MKLPKLFSYSILLIVLASPVNALWAISNDCVEINVEATVTNTTDGEANGSIKLTFKDDYKLYKIHVLRSAGKDKLNINTDLIGNLTKGKYSVVITSKDSDSRICPKFFELVVK